VSLFDFIPSPYKWLAGGIAAVAVAGFVSYWIHLYNDSIRAPLQQEINFLTDSINANKARAARELAAETAKVQAAQDERDAEIAKLRGQYNAEKSKRDAEFDALRREHGRLRDAEAAGCGQSGGGEAGGKAETPPGTAGAGGGNQLSQRLNDLLWDLIRDARKTIAQYEFCQAYAESVSAP